LEDDGSLYEIEASGESPQTGDVPPFVAREILRLAARVRELEAHLDQARQYLRIECGELGDNDWPDDLHLGDVIEKHLARPAAAHIAVLEEENLTLRKVILRDGDIRRVQPVFHQRIMDLEAEVRNLRGRLASTPGTPEHREAAQQL